MAIPKTPKPTDPYAPKAGFKALEQQSPIAPNVAKRRIERRKLPDRVYDPKKTPRKQGVNQSPAAMAAAPGFSSTTVSGAPDIAELARALKNDVDLIFEFVYNNIEFIPTYGSQKGALGCLIDGMGNSFDQSELLIELLREAGYTASFQLGELEMLQNDAAAIFGTDDNIWALNNLCAAGAIPSTTHWNWPNWYLRFTHCWVKVTISGTDYHFDPALKTYSTVSGMNLATALDYTQSTFMTNAKSGATVNSDYVQDMNRANVHNDLDEFTENLIDYINTNNPDATIDDVLGGRKITALTGTVRDTAHPDLRSGATITTWTGDIPNTYKTVFTVEYDTISESFYSKDIIHKRMTLTFNASRQAELRLDGVLQATSSAQGVGTWNSVWLEVEHPYGNTSKDEGHWQTVWAEQPYLIAQAWGNAGPQMAELHRQKEEKARFAGGDNDDEDTLGEAMAQMFATWNALKSRSCDMLNRLANCKTVLHHQTGLVGNFDDSPSMDLGGIVWASGALDNDWDNVDTNDTALAMHGISFESAALEQTTKIGGVSSTNLIHIANENGDKIYNASSSNWASAVEPNLTGYSSTDKSNIKSWWIDNNWRVCLPEDGDLTKNDWEGFGYYAISPWYGAVGIIQGGLKGTNGDETNNWDAGDNKNGKGAKASNPNNSATAGDPVQMFTGDFLYERSDFGVGSQTPPYGVEFRRTYKSSDNYKDGPVGVGWHHNHQINASVRSDVLASLGSMSPIQGAAGIVAMYVCVDLYGDLNKPMDKWVTVALTNKWLNDQSLGNLVWIEDKSDSIAFVKLPDGTYAKPLNEAGSLSLTAGKFTHTTAQGVKYKFNTAGEIATIEYPEGVTITYTYTNGKLSSVSNGLGRTLTFTYTGERITSISDGNSRTVGFAYDTGGNLETATDPEDEDIKYEYDTENRMTKYFMPANPLSAIVVNTYDALGRVKEQKDSANNVMKFYIAGPRAEFENANGDSEVWYFNDLGEAVKYIDQLDNETVFELDGLNRLTKETKPEGNSVSYEYDASNNVTKVTNKAKSGSGLSDVVNEFTYDSTWNKVKTAKDGRGNTTTYTYHATKGYLTKIEYPQIGTSTPTVEFTYNSRGQILTREDETDMKTKYAYDATKEELDSVTVDEGIGRLNLKTEFVYDSVGNMTSIKDPRGNTTTFEYDDNRRRTKATAPAPFSYQTKFSFDKNGNTTKVEKETGDVTNPWQTVTTAYEVDDLVTSITNPSSDVTSFSYNNRRLLWKTTDAESRVTEQTYDARLKVSTIKDPSLTVSETRTYTDNGLVASVKDADNNVTDYEYDGLDRLKKTTFEDNTYEQLTYDANANVTKKRTRDADDIDYTFDVLNRMTEKDPAGMPTVTYTYDLVGRRTKVSTSVVAGNPASGDFDYSFDTAGRLVGEEYPDGKDVDYELDANGNITKVTYPDGYYVEYVFDKLNRLTDIKLDGATASALDFEYDKLSRRTKLTYDNGVVTDYEYELDDDMKSLEHTFGVGSVKYTYAYNDVNELTSQQVDDSGFMWHPATAGTLSYGAANVMNQYPTVGGATQSYNDSGCLTDDGTFDYTYDAENQLTEADDATTVSRYIYDPMRRQNQKDVGGTKTRFIYSGFQMISEYNGAGSIQKKYVFGPGLDEALIELDASENLTYLHHDKMGSIVATTDGNGDVVDSYVYSPFGKCDDMTGTTFGFTGQRYDPETGLYYYKNRHYSPENGRFIQPDPLGYVDSLNLYQYAFNSPLKFSDPYGLESGQSLGNSFG